MIRSRCYLDYNATAPLRESALRACVAALQTTGNASSIHAEGRDSRRLVEQARHAVGTLVGAASDRVIFTSGGTESANLALTPDLSSTYARHGARRMLVLATEHAAVLRGHRFPGSQVSLLPVGRDGLLDCDNLDRALKADGGSPALLALQAANNETGVLQPVAEAAALVHAAGGLLVCDAVQAVGRVPFDMAASGADAVIISGHKLGGPQGTGAVVLAPGVVLGSSIVRGGGQERGLRSGTENVPGIAGFGAAAAEVCSSDDRVRLLGLRERLESGLADLDADLGIFGANAPRLPNTTCFAVPGLGAETLVMALDLEGFAISSGSACSSGKVTRSHVLASMGIAAHLSGGALRVSSGYGTRADHIDGFVLAFEAVMLRMQRRSVRSAA